MLTTIPTFQGHYGKATVVLMDNGEQVGLVATKETTLRTAFKRLVAKGCHGFDKAKVKKCVLVADTLLCQPPAK